MGGRDKLLESVAGQPLLRLVASRALATAVPVLAVLPPDRPDRAKALRGLPLQTVVAENAAQGMATSLRAGLAALPPGTTGAMILPADMPLITTADLSLLLIRHRDAPCAILRACTADGRAGHPVLFPADLFPDLMALSGDEGGRSVLKARPERLHLLPLPGDHAMLDLDTAEDWAAFRAAATGSGGE